MQQLLPAFVGVPQTNRVYHCDALTLLRAMPSASVSLIAVDPPYNGVKDEAWDNQWASDADFLEWLRAHLIEFRRVLKPNGSLYLFASPRMAARVEVLTGEYFNVLNQVVWYKTNGNRNWSADKETVRGFLPNTERIIFAEHQSSNNLNNDTTGYYSIEFELHRSVYKPLGDYFRQPREASGMTANDTDVSLGYVRTKNPMRGTELCRRWEEGSSLPSEMDYQRLQTLYRNPFDKSYADIQRWYEELRREYEAERQQYEELRRPFNVSADVPYTDVWNFATVSQYAGKHPCEKPAAMMQHIVNASSRAGDLVLDCFCGSGATLAAAYHAGRQYIGCDMDANWVEVARNRCVKEFGAKRRNAVTSLDDLPLFAQPA